MQGSSVDRAETEKQQLKEDFQRAEADYIAALNRMHGFTGSASELWQLRTALQAAHKACQEAGIVVTTVEQWAKEERVKKEQWLRTSAEEISNQKANSQLRVRWMGSLAISFAILLWFWFQAGSLSDGLLYGSLVFSFAFAWHWYVFPTPWMRLGRQAAQRGVYLTLWNDARQKEFDFGFRLERRQNKKQAG